MSKKLIYIFVFFILIISQNGFPQDSKNFKSFYYTQFNSRHSIKVLADSLNFNGYIILKLSRYAKDTNYVAVSIYFTKDLSQVNSLHESYYFAMFNYYVYGDSWGAIDSVNYYKLINTGKKNDLPENGKYFDRFDDTKNNCSLFINSNSWRLKKDYESNFFIYRTSFDGILIQDKLVFNDEYDKPQKRKVLVPFFRYLPLFEVKSSEIEKYNLLKKSALNLCK